MTLTIMIVTFAGRWFTFPRSVLGYSFIIGIIVLSLWRILVYYLYLKVSNERKVVLLGKENQVMRSIQNFMSDKNNKHKVTSVVVSNYYENLKKLSMKSILFIFQVMLMRTKSKIVSINCQTQEKNLFRYKF